MFIKDYIFFSCEFLIFMGLNPQNSWTSLTDSQGLAAEPRAGAQPCWGNMGEVLGLLVVQKSPRAAEKNPSVTRDESSSGGSRTQLGQRTFMGPTCLGAVSNRIHSSALCSLLA